MEEVKEEIKALRSKDVCEQQLAVELAVGAVDSIDSLIGQGHKVACEYACQLLFDNLREKVAQQSNLPVNIVQHLLKDRCEDIRLMIIETNWSSLTEEQQEEAICEIERYFSIEEKERIDYNFRYNSKTRQITRIIATLLKVALLERDEPAALRYIKIIGINNNNNNLPILKPDLIPMLKDMPKIFRVYWEDTSIYQRGVDVILAHPDESVRMEEIQKILDKTTRVQDLSNWKRVIENSSGQGLKTKILKLWLADPSEAIRKFIATTTTSVYILEILATDASNIVSQIAYPRYKKFRKRAEYSKAYNEHKQEKLRQEEEAAYQKKESRT